MGRNVQLNLLVLRSPWKKKMSDNGAKKFFCLFLAPAVEENYNNLLTLWKIINIRCNGETLPADLKLANLLTRLMCQSSATPCCWSTTKKEIFEIYGDLRTVGSMKKRIIMQTNLIILKMLLFSKHEKTFRF